MMKVIPKLFLIFLLLPLTVMGQVRDRMTEVGLFLGISNYQGDLAPDWAWSEIRPAIGLCIKRTTSPYFSYGAGINVGQIGGEDANFDYLAPRNLSFRSIIVEGSAQMEFNFFQFGVGLKKRKSTPYIFTGLSLFYFNPQAKLDNDWVNLQPLSTEGQGVVEGSPKPYNRVQLAIPIGGGYKFSIADRWNLAVHIGYRTAFTDYLDDVSRTYVSTSTLLAAKGEESARLSDRSGEINDGNNFGKPGFQRGNPDLKDWYIFSGVTITYVVNQKQCFDFKKRGLFVF